MCIVKNKESHDEATREDNQTDETENEGVWKMSQNKDMAQPIASHPVDTLAL